MRLSPRTLPLKIFLILQIGMLSCAYFWPATWRAFRVDPDELLPAVTRALDQKQLEIETLDQTQRKVTTGWDLGQNGVDRFRERFIISWERDEKDKTITVYVRHEAQDQQLNDGAPTWGTKHHDGDKEKAMMKLITQEIVRSEAPME